MSDDNDNILSVFSYIHKDTNTIPPHFDHVTDVLVESKPKPNGKEYYLEHKDIELSKLLVNSINKLGFIQLSYQYAISMENENSTQKNSQIHVEYFISNFIYFTKAFHDSIALIINHIGKLGLKGGDIDLNKKVFTQKLLNSNLTNIINEISKNMFWIGEVVNWRDELIHRSSNPIITKDDPGITKDFSLFIYKEPIAIFSNKRIQAKNLIPISTFCIPWIKKNIDLLESVCQDILKLYGNKSTVNAKNQ
jgi:hypothetical protein